MATAIRRVAPRLRGLHVDVDSAKSADPSQARTPVISWRSQSHDFAAEIEHAASLLRAGKLVAFPTETVYGLGANALDGAAVARIFEAKGRPQTSPIIVHVSSMEMAQVVVAEWPPAAEFLAQKFWPGPLTLVLKKQPAVSRSGYRGTGYRWRAHAVASGRAGADRGRANSHRRAQCQSLHATFAHDGGACSRRVSAIASITSWTVDRAPWGSSRRCCRWLEIGLSAAAGRGFAAADRSGDRTGRSCRRRRRLRLIRRRGCIRGTTARVRSCCWYAMAQATRQVAELTCNWSNRREGGCTKLCACPPMPRNTPRGFIACCTSSMRTATTGLRWTLRRKLAEWEAVLDRLRRAATP